MWEDYKVVGSWPGYVTAYCLIAMGIFLLSDEGKDQDQKVSLARFLRVTKEELSRPELEHHLSSHQLIILNQSRKQGLTRGNSDPEPGSGSTRFTATRTMDTFLLFITNTLLLTNLMIDPVEIHD